MKKDNEFQKFVPAIIIGVAVLALVGISKLLSKDNSAKYQRAYLIEKSEYSANEYIPILVSDEQMARKYMLDYLNYVQRNIKESYYLLDEDYRNETFGNIDKYIKYMNTYNFTYELEKYSVYERSDYKYYDIYDKNGNHVIFKTQGIMQYSVIFDDILEMGE